MFDNQNLNSHIEVIFTKNVSGTGRCFGDIVELNEKKLKVLRTLTNGESVYSANIHGISNNVNDYNIRIKNKRTVYGVRIKGNQDISNLVFWCNPKTICPEPYFIIKVEPGAEI